MMQLNVLNDTPLGFVIYDGPSIFTGNSIIAIATGFQRIKNPKTGQMLQIWIMCKNLQPFEALESGDDEDVCNSCKHRHFRSCYVNISQGPYAVWHAWRRGSYKKATPRVLEYFRDKLIRIGAYGDPVAVPLMIWDSILGVSRGWTGYTHSWKHRLSQGHKRYCMASCDTLEEVEEAKRRGWRPFYVRGEDDIVPDGFFECPASEEQNHRLDCTQCQVCNGGELIGRKGLPCIIRHGPIYKKVFFDRGIKLMRNKKAYRAGCSAA